MPPLLSLIMLAVSTVIAAPSFTPPDASGPGASRANTVPLCFTSPDRHQVAPAEGTCLQLFNKFLHRFGSRQDSNYSWTGDYSRWHEPNTIHLPKIDFLVSANQTQACIMEITDGSRVGDSYSAASVVLGGRAILQECFTQNLCGEVALGPQFTTSLALCASVHTISDSQTSQLRRRPLSNGESDPLVTPW